VLLLRRLREHRPDNRHPTSRLTAITYQWPPVGRVLQPSGRICPRAGHGRREPPDLPWSCSGTFWQASARSTPGWTTPGTGRCGSGSPRTAHRPGFVAPCWRTRCTSATLPEHPRDPRRCGPDRTNDQPSRHGRRRPCRSPARMPGPMPATSARPIPASARLPVTRPRRTSQGPRSRSLAARSAMNGSPRRSHFP